MGVAVVGQTKVPRKLGTVDSLLKRAQHHGLQYLEIRSTARLGHQLSVISGAGIVASTQMQAQIRQVLAQRFQLLGRRPLVYTIQTETLVALHEVGSAGIGDRKSTRLNSSH